MVTPATEAFQLVGFVFKTERFPGGHSSSLEEKLQSLAKRVSMRYAVILIFGPSCDLCQEKKTKQLSVISVFALKQAAIQVTLPFVRVPGSSIKDKKNI